MNKYDLRLIFKSVNVENLLIKSGSLLHSDCLATSASANARLRRCQNFLSESCDNKSALDGYNRIAQRMMNESLTNDE